MFPSLLLLIIIYPVSKIYFVFIHKLCKHSELYFIKILKFDIEYLKWDINPKKVTETQNETEYKDATDNLKANQTLLTKPEFSKEVTLYDYNYTGIT